MELVEPLLPYYLRKQRIKIHVKLPHNASRVACTILDGHGHDITNEDGLLYSKANILHAQNASRSRKCLLYVNFMHAIRHISLKLTAFNSNGEALNELVHRFRVYSQHPKGLQERVMAEDVVPQQGSLGKRSRRDEKGERLDDMEWIDLCFNEGDQKIPQLRDEVVRETELTRDTLVCGDWNSTPGSGVYAFCRGGFISLPAGSKRKSVLEKLSGQWQYIRQDSIKVGQAALDGQRCPELPYVVADKVDHGVEEKHQFVQHTLGPLHSAYAYVCAASGGVSDPARETGEPAITQYHRREASPVDFQFFCGPAVCVGVFEMPLYTSISRCAYGQTNHRYTNCLPNKYLGSDHLSLVGDFVFIEKVPGR